MSFVLKKDLLYRQFSSKDKKQDYLQLIVPKGLRNTVMKIGHETAMAGHMGTKRTLDRLTMTFYWPGINSDVRLFCRSCDQCQKTEPLSRTRKVPLGRMPIISEPFRRIAVDLVGPITLASDAGYRYTCILVAIDYST